MIHYEGKLLPHLTWKEKMERIVIIATGGEKEALHGIPMISRGTGTEQAKAVLNGVTEAGLENRVQGTVIDTNASNTRLSEGACVKIQMEL